jgi:hypothetical protein
MTTLAGAQATAPDTAPPAARAAGPGASKINPVTGLSTDYLNHFNEAIMVLEMVAVMPECIPDLEAWHPKNYREHFASSHFSDRDAVLAAYDAADPTVRQALDSAAATLNAVLAETQEAVLKNVNLPETANAFAQRSVEWLKPLVARTGAVINGTAHSAPDWAGPQAAIDSLFNR